MPRTTRYKSRMDLMQGTLDLIIHQTLRRGPHTGYGTSKGTKTAPSQVPCQADTGAPDPGLDRLAARGWIACERKTTDNNQRAKCYRLTPTGRKRLASEQSRWSQFVEAMAALMKAQDHEA